MSHLNKYPSKYIYFFGKKQQQKLFCNWKG